MKTCRRFLVCFVLIVLLLIEGTGVRLCVQRRQYALNRQLIAALVQNDTEKSLGLVEAGADPNTRMKPSPAPSLKQLLEQCLRHKSLPANDSPTAFMLACGLWTPPEDGAQSPSTRWVEVPYCLPLLRSMILHGADVNAREANALTVLMAAVSYGHGIPLKCFWNREQKSIRQPAMVQRH